MAHTTLFGERIELTRARNFSPTDLVNLLARRRDLHFVRTDFVEGRCFAVADEDVPHNQAVHVLTVALLRNGERLHATSLGTDGGTCLQITTKRFSLEVLDEEPYRRLVLRRLLPRLPAGTPGLKARTRLLEARLSSTWSRPQWDSVYAVFATLTDVDVVERVARQLEFALERDGTYTYGSPCTGECRADGGYVRVQPGLWTRCRRLHYASREQLVLGVAHA